LNSLICLHEIDQATFLCLCSHTPTHFVWILKIYEILYNDYSKIKLNILKRDPSRSRVDALTNSNRSSEILSRHQVCQYRIDKSTCCKLAYIVYRSRAQRRFGDSFVRVRDLFTISFTHLYTHYNDHLHIYKTHILTIWKSPVSNSLKTINLWNLLDQWRIYWTLSLDTNDVILYTLV